MTAVPPAIEARGLGRDYGDAQALGAVDLVVPRGALMGVLGPNGAGKTTLMLLLATLLSPSRGAAQVLGHDIVRERAAVRRRLGLVFQEPSIDGLLTVQENLRFAAGLMGLRGAVARAAVDRAIDRTGLRGHASRPARQLSGGWRRLADIARATLHQPDLLILDEPTVGLDPEHRDRMWSLLETERRERQATILFSTHYLAEAESCDRVVMLARGTAVADNTPAALMADLGEQVLEVEGADADRAVQALRDVADVRLSIKTERGYRLAVGRALAGVDAIVRAAPHLSRLDIRRATLEDVYFALTQPRATSGTP